MEGDSEPLYWHVVFTWLGSYHPKTSPSCIACIVWQATLFALTLLYTVSEQYS